MRTRKASRGGNPLFTRKHVKAAQVMPFTPKLNRQLSNNQNIRLTTPNLRRTKKLVRPVKLVSMRAKLNEGLRNNRSGTAQPIKPILQAQSFSIRNLPTYEATAQVMQQQKPTVLSQFSTTRKHKFPRTKGYRNIFKSMENKDKFKKVLKNVYGSKSENVYKFWETHKNNLMNNLRSLEGDAESRRSVSSNNTNDVLFNQNPEFYRQMKDLYGKNYANFQDYISRAKKQKIDVQRYSF